MGEDKPTTPPAETAPPAPPRILPKGRGPKPPEDVAWTHQPGCMNPISDDWDCACGPELIRD